MQKLQNEFLKVGNAVQEMYQFVIFLLFLVVDCICSYANLIVFMTLSLQEAGSSVQLESVSEDRKSASESSLEKGIEGTGVIVGNEFSVYIFSFVFSLKLGLRKDYRN